MKFDGQEPRKMTSLPCVGALYNKINIQQI